MQGSEVEWLSLTNKPCGLHSWGSVKVAGHVFFVSLRIHAGGRGMRQIRGHSMWEGGMPRMAK